MEVIGKIITKGLFTEKIVRIKIKNIRPVVTNYKPGQYISLKISENEYVPYYIFRYYKEINAFEIAVNIAKEGPEINYIKSAGVGSDVVYKAPQGKLILDEDAKKTYLIAEGTYVSPFLSYLYRIEKTTKKPVLSLFWGVKDEKELFLVNTIYAFSSSMPNFTYDLFISEGTSAVTHRPGRIVDAISKVQFSEKPRIYICGGHAMMTEVAALLKSKNISKEDIIFEYLD